MHEHRTADEVVRADIEANTSKARLHDVELISNLVHSFHILQNIDLTMLRQQFAVRRKEHRAVINLVVRTLCQSGDQIDAMLFRHGAPCLTGCATRDSFC